MNISQAIKLVRENTGMNFVDARKLVMALVALDVIKLDEKPKPDGVWSVDDEVTIWQGC